MKNILWLQAGGTIACVKTSVGLSPENSNISIPLIESGFSCTSESVFSLDSSDITPAHWQRLAERVFHSRDDYDGFVITHGTDTMQYSAAALSLMLENFDKPVIFTGSMKPFGAKDSDAPFNLTSAFAAARDLSSTNCGGVFLVFAGKIMRGLSCVKINTVDLDAFTDVKGVIGEATPDGARLFAEFEHKKPTEPAVLKTRLCEKVFMLKITPNLGLNDNIADFLIEKGYKGVVCEAYGLGGVPRGFLDALEKMVKAGIRVIIASDCLFGGANLSVYAAHRRLKDLAPAVKAWEMTPAAALVGLMLEVGGEGGITPQKPHY